MKKIELLARDLNVTHIRWALLGNPHLWNENTARTQDERSPHHGLDDIWARFGTPDNAETGEAHSAHWYPSADVLDIKYLVQSVYDAVGGKELGGVLITRIPAGATCKPHEDHGWHARYYEKFAVQIDSAPGQKFCFEGVELESQPGDLFWFDNQYLHWVDNPTAYDRITMIICIKRGE